jgi:hypothetical protein
MNKLKLAFKKIGGKIMELNKAVVESRERTTKYILDGLKDPNNRMITGIITIAVGVGVIAVGGGLCISSLVEVTD